MGNVKETIKSRGLLIGGEWITKSNVEPIYNKYTNEVIGYVAVPEKSDVERAVRVARKSLKTIH